MLELWQSSQSSSFCDVAAVVWLQILTYTYY